MRLKKRPKWQSSSNSTILQQPLHQPAEKRGKLNESENGLPPNTGSHLNSDFKKRGGHQRSIELSHEYGLPPGLLRLRLFPPGTRRTGGSTGKWQQLMCSLKCPAKSPSGYAVRTDFPETCNAANALCSRSFPAKAFCISVIFLMIPENRRTLRPAGF